MCGIINQGAARIAGTMQPTCEESVCTSYDEGHAQCARYTPSRATVVGILPGTISSSAVMTHISWSDTMWVPLEPAGVGIVIYRRGRPPTMAIPYISDVVI